MVRRTSSRFESKPRILKKSENRPIAAAYQTHLILRSNISSRRGERKNIHWYSKKVFDLSKDDRSTVPVRAKSKFSAEFRNFHWLRTLWIIGYDGDEIKHLGHDFLNWTKSRWNASF